MQISTNGIMFIDMLFNTCNKKYTIITKSANSLLNSKIRIWMVIDCSISDHIFYQWCLSACLMYELKHITKTSLCNIQIFTVVKIGNFQ